MRSPSAAHGIPAQGWLVGEVHNGIAQMFDVIEHARMMVGTRQSPPSPPGLPQRSRLRQAARAGRRPDPDDQQGSTARDHHAPPRVRRSLAMQKAYAEGLRAVYLYTAAHQDEVVAQLVSGADKDTAFRVNDLLLPIVKGVGSERAYQYLTDSLQTLGGSGFLQDYPIEQYIRDSKIDSLYEGTTAIQAQDFFFRKIARDRGVALAHVAGQIKTFIDSEAGNGRLKAERALLAHRTRRRPGHGRHAHRFLMGAQEQPTELYKVGLGSVRFLMSVGDLLIGWQLLRQSEIALAALDNGASDKDKGFYEGKVAIASFFAKTSCPSSPLHARSSRHRERHHGDRRSSILIRS